MEIQTVAIGAVMEGVAPVETATAVDSAEAKNGSKGAAAAGRQLKELRSLMPWNWDARIEDHPPGEKAMVDFEDVVNYRYHGRRRGRSLSAVEEVERFKKVEEAKADREKKRLARLEREAKKQQTEKPEKDASGSRKKGRNSSTASSTVAARPLKKVARVSIETKKKDLVQDNSNKENVAPKTDSVETVDNVNVVATATVTPAAATGRKNKPRSCTKEQAVTTPGFMLTPVTDGPVSAQRRSMARKTGGSSSSLKRATNTAKMSYDNKRLTAEKPRRKSQRVTFGNTQKAAPATNANISIPRETAPVVNSRQSLTIDLDKYGYGIGVRRPPGCPPLFRTMEDHGRMTVPSFMPMFQLPALPPNDSRGDHYIPRVCTPFQGKPASISREVILAQMVQAGLRAAEELGEMVAKGAKQPGQPAAPVVPPFELSPQLAAALAQLGCPGVGTTTNMS